MRKSIPPFFISSNRLFLSGIVAVLLLTISCSTQLEKEVVETSQEYKDEVLKTYLHEGAWRYHFLRKEWGEWIDKGLVKDSTIAYLWQQRAMPLWKKRKYNEAISYFNHAVELDRERYLCRLGFLKCVFAKDYKAALVDLDMYIKEYGTIAEQDHNLEFYQALCYLQLNQYQKAHTIFENEVAKQEKENGLEWVHFLDRFYLAISLYELKEYNRAIEEFDKVLQAYPQFSDAKYYKSMCLKYTNRAEEASSIMAEGKQDFETGYTFNEDSSVYEDYPYQITWQWKGTEFILR